MTYLNAKKYINTAPSDTACDTSRLNALFEQLGSPQRKLKYLRLAGSNGKSVCAEMLASVISKAGYTVGCLKMPLSDEPRENVCVNSRYLSMDEFAEHTALIKQVSKELQISPNRSEILLAIALLAFKRAACNLCIIESDHFGNDSSKALPTPFAAVICGAIPNGDASEISKIRSYISNGISEIVSVPQNSEAYRIISDTCYSVKCRLTLPSKNACIAKQITTKSAKPPTQDANETPRNKTRDDAESATITVHTADNIGREFGLPSNSLLRLLKIINASGTRRIPITISHTISGVYAPKSMPDSSAEG